MSGRRNWKWDFLIPIPVRAPTVLLDLIPAPARSTRRPPPSSLVALRFLQSRNRSPCWPAATCALGRRAHGTGELPNPAGPLPGRAGADGSSSRPERNKETVTTNGHLIDRCPGAGRGATRLCVIASPSSRSHCVGAARANQIKWRSMDIFVARRIQFSCSPSPLVAPRYWRRSRPSRPGPDRTGRHFGAFQLALADICSARDPDPLGRH